MEAKFVNLNNLPGILHQLLPGVGPGLLIGIGYVDPGKWAATVEGGARFGYDSVLPMLIFNFTAILCQYLSARIGWVGPAEAAKNLVYLVLRRTSAKNIVCLVLSWTLMNEPNLRSSQAASIKQAAHVLHLTCGIDMLQTQFQQKLQRQ
ncbi:hypothetical protein GH714_028095 [Hevea brasiliensis]|uniref:Uncharacterized protein n=1 Tax=Hevea brasiliensis TaxID=3981 RepID=A0A6A6MFQ7_HEVBR|nr:hypothetical protein GH714_028095 [Hevea brasiliensis]